MDSRHSLSLIVSLSLSLLFAFCLPDHSRASTIVSPGNFANTEAPGVNSFPFDISNGAGFSGGVSPITSMRYQQIYPASDFSAFTSGGEWITQIDFRPNGDYGLGSSFNSTLPDIQIDLSTSTVAPASLSGTFQDNVGSDDKVVVSRGPLSLSSSDTPVGGSRDFEIVIHLTTPFFYNPSQGNLLLDIRNFGAGSTTSFDAVQTGGFRAFSSTGGSANSSTAFAVDGSGLVTQFISTNSIPEPGNLSLLVCAAMIGFTVYNPFRRSRSPSS